MKKWLRAFRLRTLPLSLSGITLGGFLALENQVFSREIFVLACLTTICFQVLSNLANDYGDGVKGTDNENRIGPERALQSGVITPKQMYNAIIIFVILSLIFSIGTIYISFTEWKYALLFLFLGIVSIGAAIKYTMGKSAYGYRGLGDIFVFLFFGLLAVLGTYFLFDHHLKSIHFLPAIAIGCLSTAVLNLNNMRDLENDTAVGKNTVAVKLGFKNAKIYHYVLILIPIICLLSYFTIKGIVPYLLLVPIALLIKHLLFIKNVTVKKQIDYQLKIVALTTFLYAILWGVQMFI